MDIMKAHTQEEFKTFMSQLLETNANLGFYTDFAKCHANVNIYNFALLNIKKGIIKMPNICREVGLHHGTMSLLIQTLPLSILFTLQKYQILHWKTNILT